MQFGLWLPVYGGWLRAEGFDSEPSTELCLALAETAEQHGYDALYASENFLNCIHGRQHDVCDAWTLLAALAARTSTVELIGAVKPNFRPPLVAAQMIATVDKLSAGRVSINVVCGWWREEFEACGVAWRSHDEKYDDAARYLGALRRCWAGEPDVPTRRRLCQGRQPSVWIGGQSDAALDFAAGYADVLFLNGMPPAEIERIRERVHARNGRPVVAMNAFIIAGDSDGEAAQRCEDLIGRGRRDLIGLFRSAQTDAGAAAWAGLSDRDMVDANGGMAAGLIGSVETITRRLAEFADAGVDLVVCQFADMLVEAKAFALSIMPHFRQQPAQRAYS